MPGNPDGGQPNVGGTMPARKGQSMPGEAGTLTCARRGPEVRVPSAAHSSTK
jgi:hypothetical protein